MTDKIKYPRFPNETLGCYGCQEWRKKVKEIIEKQIKKDSVMMGEDIASYFDIRPLLEALK